MTRRQTSVPRQWLVADERLGSDLWPTVRSLPKGSGIYVVYGDLKDSERKKLLARLRRLARIGGLVVADEAAGEAMRVHNLRELREAAIASVPLIFVSPLFATRSHPGRTPLRRITAATLLRLAPMPAIALGGMNEPRFRSVEAHGFSGWAGIDAWCARRQGRKLKRPA